MARFLLSEQPYQVAEAVMLCVYVENIVDMAILGCEGSIVTSEDAFKLRKAVISQAEAHIVVLDLSEVNLIEGSGLDMLLLLQRWSHGRNIQLKLFNPTNLVKYVLEHANPTPQFDFATLNEMMALLTRADTRDPPVGHDFTNSRLHRDNGREAPVLNP